MDDVSEEEEEEHGEDELSQLFTEEDEVLIFKINISMHLYILFMLLFVLSR